MWIQLWISPIWPSLHFGCATTLPPIQKNSSASLEMDAFCQSFGELIMDGLGELMALEPCFSWWKEALASEGENLPADRDPRDWKVVFLGDMQESGGLPLSPGDRGAIAGVLFIPELYIWVQLSCPIHVTWTHRPLKCVYSTASLMQIVVSARPLLPDKVHWEEYSHPEGSVLVILCPVILCSSHRFFCFYFSLWGKTPSRGRVCNTCQPLNLPQAVILEEGFSLAFMEGFSRNQ